LTNVNVIHDDATGGVSVFGQVPIDRTRTSAEMLDRAEVLHRRVNDLQSESAGFRRERLIAELEDRQNLVASQAGSDLLRTLSEAGFAWRDVARLAQVSVPAIQKWRRGEGMTGANRHKLAKIVALLDLLDQHFVSDPVSWLEMPLREQVSISRLDLLVDNRYDLVLELLSDDDGAASLDGLLDEYDPLWRNHFVDDRFESFMAPDGIVSIRPKS
jgi:hypothetical protein